MFLPKSSQGRHPTDNVINLKRAKSGLSIDSYSDSGPTVDWILGSPASLGFGKAPNFYNDPDYKPPRYDETPKGVAIDVPRDSLGNELVKPLQTNFQIQQDLSKRRSLKNAKKTPHMGTKWRRCYKSHLSTCGAHI